MTTYTLGHGILRKVAKLDVVTDEVLGRLDRFEGTADDVRVVADVLADFGFIADSAFVLGTLDRVEHIAGVLGPALTGDE